MLIGLLSDTHGRSQAMAAAVALLQSHSAEFFIHCGDVGSLAVLDHLAGLPSAFVWGNCDFDRQEMARYGQKLGIQCLGALGELNFDDKRIAILHGDDHRLKQELLAEQRFDYLFQGHTHISEDVQIRGTRLINPGALFRANPKTVALVDTAQDRVQILSVEGI